MAKKALTPVVDQIAAYRKQFDLYAELEGWMMAHPAPEYGLRYKPGSPWITYEKDLGAKRRELTGRGWDGSKWHWDEEWDGKLVERVQALADAGFEVQRFWRKQKIDLRMPPLTTKVTVILRLERAVGEDWVGLNFRRNGWSVWWQGGGPWKSYRP